MFTRVDREECGLSKRGKATIPKIHATWLNENDVSCRPRGYYLYHPRLYLCSFIIIPHDKYTPPVPRYSGDFISTLELPVSLPLPNEKPVYTGPEKLSKRGV